jgi:hypothetical protein
MQFQKCLFLTSSHIFSKKKLTFGTGVYAGMYAAQNFDVPKVDEPEKVFEKITKMFSEAKKEVEEAKKKIDK